MTEETELRRALEEAAEGLVYTSESDRPFEGVEYPGAGAIWPMSAVEFASLVHAPEGTVPEERTLDEFFARHIESTDPHDTEAQRIRPRYERLKETLASRLREVRVFRVGKIQVDCYVVGEDGRGNVAGLRTVAVET